MKNQEILNQDQTENEEFVREEEGTNKKLGAAPIWIVSLLLHGIVLAALAWILVEQAKKKEDLILTQKISDDIIQTVGFTQNDVHQRRVGGFGRRVQL